MHSWRGDHHSAVCKAGGGPGRNNSAGLATAYKYNQHTLGWDAATATDKPNANLHLGQNLEETKRTDLVSMYEP